MDEEEQAGDFDLTLLSPVSHATEGRDVSGDEVEIHKRTADSTSSGRGDFGGIDNEALDFSQLEDYINDDEDNAIYFPDSLVAATGVGGGGVEVKTNHDVTSGLKPPPPVPNRNTPPQSRVQTPSLLYTLTNSNYKNGPVPYHPTQPHPLPESPPDSGSEPPFSPADEGTHGKVVTPSVTGLQEMLMHPPPVPTDAMKHLLNYTNTQPLKHLPSLGGEGPLGPIGVHPIPVPNITPGLQGPPPPVSTAPSPMPLPTLFGSLNGSVSSGMTNVTVHQNKKRKLSESPNSTVNASILNGLVHIKQEPGHGMALPSRHCISPDPTSNQSNQPSMSEEDYAFDFTGDPNLAFMEAAYQCIRFQSFQQSTWHTLCDRNLKELPTPNYRVDADKGFNFSHADDAFVCQKKNHFQVTVHTQMVGEAHFVKTPEGLKKIDNFCLHFNGAKVESPSQTIKVEQSQSDRSKKAFHPVLLDLSGDQVTKVTVGRLHFSETTSNNMRKKGKPNPDQRYFYLVVSLNAHCGDDNYVLVSHASERIIVRVMTASNPGQFENDVELCWQKGHTPDSIFHGGRVGINTDRPDEALVIHGNVKVTGHIMQPSDARAKQRVTEVDTKEQLRNLQQLRIVHYQYKPDFASHVGLAEDEQSDTGVIAQEVQQVLPEAVKEAGDIVLPNGQCISNFLVVNKERIFMENVGAVKELCKVTDNLENRIDELERMNRKLAKLKRIDSLKSTSSGSTVVSRASSTPPSTSSTRRYHHRPRKLDNSHGVCSNRFVQMTITILIIIMALCLVAMATLYILEWQNRHIYEGIPPSTQLSELTTSPSNMTFDLLKESAMGNPEKVASVTIETPQPPSPRMRTPTSGRNSTSVNHPESFFPKAVRRKPFPIGAPKHCYGGAARFCPTFCCSSYIDNIELSTSPRSNHISTQQQILQGPDNLTTMTPPPYLDQAPASTLPSQNIDIYNSMNKVNDGAVNSGFENAPNTLNDPPSNDPNNPGHIVRKREAKQRVLMPKSPRSDFDQLFQSVTIPELNLTLGREYCYNEQCLTRGGNYSYTVPISKFMPNQSLTLQFQLSSTTGVVIDLCHKVNGNHGCYAAEPSPYFEERKEGDNASWLLPIGYYAESSYRFRMPNREWRHQVVCDPGLTDAGSTFIEFNFVFYRKCEDHITQQATPIGSKA